MLQLWIISFDLHTHICKKEPNVCVIYMKSPEKSGFFVFTYIQFEMF